MFKNYTQHYLLFSKSSLRASFSFKDYTELNLSLALCGASLHCGWDTAAAPVADVSRKWCHTISHPVGHSPLCAIIECCCVWKKMIMERFKQFAVIDNQCHELLKQKHPVQAWTLYNYHHPAYKILQTIHMWKNTPKQNTDEDSKVKNTWCTYTKT